MKVILTDEVFDSESNVCLVKDTCLFFIINVQDSHIVPVKDKDTDF